LALDLSKARVSSVVSYIIKIHTFCCLCYDRLNYVFWNCGLFTFWE
jgi:hypothetical protein